MEIAQIVGAILGVSGLSAAPWIAALLSGRLIPRSWVERELKSRDETIARIEKERDYERTAKAVHEDRARELGDKVGELATELGQTAVHLLDALPKPKASK